MADGMIRPVSRSKSEGRFGRQQQQQQSMILEADSDLNVRVKERDPTSVEERPRSRLMNAIFKGAGGADSFSSTEPKTNELKETLKRPLSSLFRRSQSQTDRNSSAAAASLQGSTTAPFLPQQQPPRPVPTGRSPIVVGNQQQQPKGAMGTKQTIARGSGIANGNSSTVSSVSTTAIRPFSGFPGRRPPVMTQTESTHGQSLDTDQQQLTTGADRNFNIDLSEQAAIAPQISLRRLSGLVYSSDHGFARMDDGGHKGNSGKTGGEIDVNFLSRFLCPEDESSDERIPWNWDSLFVSVSNELREEWALEEEANNNEMAAGGLTGELGTMPNGLTQQQSRRTDDGQHNQKI